MGKRHPQESPGRGNRPAFLQPLTAVYKRLARNRDGVPTATPGAADRVHDAGSEISAPANRCDALASELFARLLLELPEHRRDLLSAHEHGNENQLARVVHKLLGGVVYCEIPDLAAALRDLKETLGSADAGRKDAALGKAIRIIDRLLACSGYRGK